MGKQKSGVIIVLLLAVSMITLGSAFEINEDIDTTISLKCDESYTKDYTIIPDTDENITVTPGIISDSNMNLGLTFHPSTKHLTISIFQVGDCIVDNKEFSFSINDELYNIYVNVTEDLWFIDNVTLKEDEKITIGGIAEFSILTAGGDNVLFNLEGCEDDVEDFLDVGEFFDANCDGEIIRFEILDSYEDLQASKIRVMSSESGYNLIKGEYQSKDSSECILGLDTLGAKVKRGNIFAIKTINVEDNKAVSKVSVTIVDQTGELNPINGLSSNTGFFSERLHESYEQDLIVELEKEGCEPSTQIILFQNTYNDYVKQKDQEENSKTLNISFEGEFQSGQEIGGSVINLLQDSIDNAEVRITRPNGVSFTQKTKFDGRFNFTLDESGIWKVQVGKEDYVSSELFEFQVSSSEFTVIPLVDGEYSEFFSKGDKIIFELRDINDTIVKRNVSATYGDQTVEFIDGSSEEVVFEERTDLIIPEGQGFDEYDFTLKEKALNFNWTYIGIGAGVIILVIIIFSFIGKGKNKTKKGTEPLIEFGN